MDGEQKKSLVKKIAVVVLVVVGILVILFIALVMFVSNRATHAGFGIGSDSLGVTSGLSSGRANGATFANPLSFSSQSFGAVAKNGATMMDVAPSSAPEASGVSAADRKIMQSGALSIRVADADDAVGTIRDIAKSHGGFVTNVSLYGGVRGSKSGTLTVSVPFVRFDEAMAEIKKVASLKLSETVSGNDVTEAYVDLTARIDNKRAEEQAYAGLLERAQKMSDIIELTQALSKVRSDIESMEGQKRYYDSRTTMATITVSLSEDVTTPIPVSDGFRPWQAIKDSAHTLALFLEDFVLGMINFVIVLIPVLLLIGLVVFLIILAGFQVIRRLWKRFFSPENRQ
jgi:hypothetical protein